MAKKIKMTRKQMKKPDEFLSWTEQIWDWSQEHLWEALGIVAGVIILVIVVQLLGGFIRGRGDTSSQDMGKALAILRADVGKDKASSLNPTAANTYQTDDEKYRAAQTSFETVLTEHRGSIEADLAMLYLGQINEKLKDFAKANDYYLKFINTKTTQKDADLANSAYLGLGRCFYAQKQYQPALDNFNKVIESKSVYSPDAMSYAAMSYYLMGNQDQGKEMLARLKKEYPEAWVSESSDFLAQYLPKEADKIKNNQGDKGKGSSNVHNVDLDPMLQNSNTLAPKP